MDDDPKQDEWLERLLDRALEGFDQVLGPSELDAVRARLREELLVSPEGQRRLRAARPDATVERSGDVDRAGNTPETAVPRKLKGA